MTNNLFALRKPNNKFVTQLCIFPFPPPIFHTYDKKVFFKLNFSRPQGMIVFVLETYI
jgi:hypothetical protein